VTMSRISAPAYPPRASKLRSILISLAIVMAVWEILGRFVINNDLVFAPLSSIFLRMFTLAQTGELWKHVVASGTAFSIGYTLAVLFGILLGFLIATRPRLAFYIEPWLGALYATPMIALAPIFVVVLGIGLSSKVAIIFIEAFFPITANTALGIRSTPRELIDASISFGATETQRVRTILFPFSLPFIIAGMRIAVGRGLAGVVVAEIFGSVAGIGNMIWFSAEAYDMPKLFSGVFILAGTSVTLMAILAHFERKIAPWRQ
jgi:NitT/TauT family transport system permease protein